MHIELLSIEAFQNYVKNHPLRNYCQTINYGLMMGEFDYDYELLGLVNNDRIYAASLVLTKRIGHKMYFAYAPKGFLIDYTDSSLVTTFIDEIKKYYDNKGFVFIKINPEIAVGEVNTKTYNTEYNRNYQIVQTLQINGFKKISNGIDLDETLFPTFTGIIPLKGFNIDKVTKNTRNKIKKGIRKGLHLELGDQKQINVLKKIAPPFKDFYYDDLFNAFNKNDLIDIFLVSIDYEEYLINSQNTYENESIKNEQLSKKMLDNPNKKKINAKMNSDKALLTYKNDIIEASKYLNSNKKVYIAGAITIKDSSRVHIIASGFDKNYKHFAPNYYLHYAIMDYYKDKYDFIDLNGLSGDFSKTSDYYGVNKFKMGFNPKIYELIGEYDLVFSDKNYNLIFDESLLGRFLKNIK